MFGCMCNILEESGCIVTFYRKKCEKIDNQCYATSNISCLSLVHIVLLLVTILVYPTCLDLKRTSWMKNVVTWTKSYNVLLYMCTLIYQVFKCNQ